nr:type II toxin-antitoxin system VapC family toxin [Kineosphaera limosa]
MAYIDSSALLKRVVEESESGGLRSWLTQDRADGNRWIASDLADVEVARSCLRAGLGEDDQESAMSGVSLRAIDERVITRARSVVGPQLRSLDAIHLATALIVGVDAMITYDDRLTEAARKSGLEVLAPR